MPCEDRSTEKSPVLFRSVGFDVAGLINYIENGDIGLPDIQRPFVWNSTKVRDLFDSMYRGFPVGFLLFWANPAVNNTRQIGFGEKIHKIPSLLIIDGQQRLTSLYSVFKGKSVLDEKYRESKIEIAFKPIDGRFEVADAAIRKDPEFISNISELWSSKKTSYRVVSEFLNRIESKRELTEEEKERISSNIDRVFDLQNYPFTALEIASTVDEEQVADIFVRVNSEGVKLNQADFILTLLSVFDDAMRHDLEYFSRATRIPPKRGEGASPYNHFIEAGPDQILRVAIALAFKRARLKSVYHVLRGKDLDTGLFSDERREQQFALLRDAQKRVMDLAHWHQFFNCLVGAGYRSGSLVSSDNTLLYAYVFYLIGRTQHGMQEYELQKLIGRWFYASSLSGRYTNSPETTMDMDLNRIRDSNNKDEFSAALDKVTNDTLTGDFWSITLPNELATSSSRSPGLFAFVAAQITLGAPVLFSRIRIAEIYDPSLSPSRSAIERHHLFPRGWLEAAGIKDLKTINQVANFSLLEWPDNVRIKDAPPKDYLPRMRERFDNASWTSMCEMHALPDKWEEMPYEEFLQKRRLLMAQIIKRGYETLG